MTSKKQNLIALTTCGIVGIIIGIKVGLLWVALFLAGVMILGGLLGVKIEEKWQKSKGATPSNTQAPESCLRNQQLSDEKERKESR